MCDGLSVQNVQTPATTDRDISFDSGEVFESPPQFLISAPVPLSSSATFDSSGESFTEDPLPTPEASTIPSSTSASPRHDRAQSEISLRANRQAPPSARLDPKACELCEKQFDGSEQLVNHLNNKHQDLPNFCGRMACQKKGRWNRRELIRHLDTVKVHQGSATRVFRCRCGSPFARKEKFRDHLKKFTCKGNQPLVCWCGTVTLDYRMGSDFQGFEAHFEACGRRKKGRPPKERKGTMQERKTTGGVLAPE